MGPCKEHIGCRNRGGYGVVRHNGNAHLAHRVAYCKAHGISLDEIKGMVVRHACDNRCCVEPSHLLVGTQADNVRDMLERGRQRYTPLPHPYGTNNPASKLSYETALAIRAEYKNGIKQKDLARKFGVSQALISYVINKKIWHGALCEINAAIAPLSITAAGLAALGFEHVATDRASKLYRACDFSRMVAAMTNHLQTLALPA